MRLTTLLFTSFLAASSGRGPSGGAAEARPPARHVRSLCWSSAARSVAAARMAVDDFGGKVPGVR